MLQASPCPSWPWPGQSLWANGGPALDVRALCLVPCAAWEGRPRWREGRSCSLCRREHTGCPDTVPAVGRGGPVPHRPGRAAGPGTALPGAVLHPAPAFWSPDRPLFSSRSKGSARPGAAAGPALVIPPQLGRWQRRAQGGRAVTVPAGLQGKAPRGTRRHGRAGTVVSGRRVDWMISEEFSKPRDSANPR